jgi:GNAT superfamily N-acetyltransferase
VLKIRPARPDDVDAIVAMVHELADYERAPESCVVSSEHLRTALFGEAPAVFGHVAELDGDVVGMAVWFLTFSTWEGVHGIWVEDLFVRESARGSGAGTALLNELGKICRDRGYARMEWVVLDWNEPSIGFYRALGAEHMHEWHTYRLTGAALAALGQEAS